MLSVLFFFFFLILGVAAPKKMGWFVLITFPLGYAMYAVIIPSGLFPLTWLRFSFAITIGVLLSKYKQDLPVKYILKSRLILLLTVFYFYLFILEVGGRIMPFISSYLPGLFLSLILPFILIKSKSDVQKLTKIFVWQGGIIGFFIIIEYFTGFNPYNLFLKINQSIGEVNYVTDVYIRGGFMRVKGLAGHPVDTGYLLAFYFPLAVWYLSSKSLISKLLFIFIFIGIVMVQTRAAYIAVAISTIAFIFIMLGSGLNRMKNTFNKVGRIVLVIFFLGIITLLLYPKIGDVVYVNTINMFTEKKGFGIAEKTNRIPVALGYFLNRPLGHGSPAYVYNVLMNSDDLPAPLIYLLAGGVILGFIYLVILWILPITMFKIANSKLYYGDEKIFLVLVGCAMLASVVVVFSNWREKHLLTTYILYIAVYKIYYLKLGLKTRK